MRKVLFICMGNICRSPLAEEVFRAHARRRGVEGLFVVDSAGTGGWHAGELPDPRSCAVAQRYGLTLSHRAREITEADFTAWDMLVCMDENNRRAILRRGAPVDRVHLVLDFDGSSGLVEVPDPYEGDETSFQLVYRLLDGACAGLLDRLTETHDHREVRY